MTSASVGRPVYQQLQNFFFLIYLIITKTDSQERVNKIKKGKWEKNEKRTEGFLSLTRK